MAILPTGLLILILQCLSTVNAGKVKVNNNPQVRVTTSFTNFDARIMDQWSNGGGSHSTWVIGTDSGHPFQNRSFGGASRNQITGTGAYGSGYTYGVPDGDTMANRDFPFGVWPIYWGNNYMGSDEYGPQNDGARPGGQLVVIQIKAQSGHYSNSPDSDIYYAIGDRDSTLGVMVSFVTWCYAQPAWPTKFQPTSPNSTVKVENVITYYRASSFALASPNYNNTFALLTPPNHSTSPIPDAIKTSAFWKCLDGVTSNALMIMNPPPPKPESLGVTMGIIFGVLGLPILGALVWVVCMLFAWADNIKRRVQRGKDQKRLEAERRKAALAYENYP